MAYIKEFVGWGVLQILTILVTLVRLAHRWHRQQLWWDDFWMVGATVMGVLVVINTYCMGQDPMAKWIEDSYGTLAYFLWSSYLTSHIMIWCARISMVLSIARIQPDGMHKRVTQASFGIMVAFLVANALLTSFMCGTPPPDLLICDAPRYASLSIVVFQLTTATWLICWPIYLLSRWTRLPAFERKLIIACFGSGIVLIIFDIFHAVNLIRAENIPGGRSSPDHFPSLMASGNLQSTLSVLCSNSLVLVPYIYRRLRKEPPTAPETTDAETSGAMFTSTGPTTTTNHASDMTSTKSHYTSHAGESSGGIYSTIDRPITTVHFSQRDASAQSDGASRSAGSDSEKDGAGSDKSHGASSISRPLA